MGFMISVSFLPVIISVAIFAMGYPVAFEASADDLELYLEEYRKIPDGMEVHISSYLEGAREFDLDFLCNGEEIVTIGIMEHLEPAGVHSGDAISIGGP